MAKFTVYGLPGVYNATPITLNDGDGVALAVDVNGRVILSDTGSSIPVNTELPAAALLADNTATPTTPAVGAFNMVYDGATWDMLRGDSTNGAFVNIKGDGLTALQNIDTDLTTLIGNTDQLEGYVDQLEGFVDQLEGFVDGLEGLLSGTLTVDTELTTADLDTGAGTDTRAVVGLVGSKSGGGELIPGSATDGLLVNLGTNNDVTLASTTITGTVAVTQSGTWDEVGINDSGNNISIDWGGTVPPIGAGLEATALRVTVATDSTGVLSVDDNGSALTVDASDLDIRDLTSASDSVSVLQATASNLNAQVVGNIASGVTDSDNPVKIGGKYNLTLPTFTDGQRGDLQITSRGSLRTHIVSSDGITAISGLPDNTDDVAVITSTTAMKVINRNTVFDGTAWDRMRGDSTDGVLVNLGTNNDVVDSAAEASLGVMDDWDNGASDGASVSGDVAHDSPDAGEPVKVGMKAVALKANPTEVAANDRTNWIADVSGVPFVLGGHPNILTQSLQVTDADGAQTDAAIITAGANVAVVVTKVSVMADNANTADVSVRIGFGTVNTPAADAAQMLLFHPGIAPGSGVVEGNGSGILGIGASGEDVRVTCEDAVGGSINIIVTYFTTDI